MDVIWKLFGFISIVWSLALFHITCKIPTESCHEANRINVFMLGVVWPLLVCFYLVLCTITKK